MLSCLRPDAATLSLFSSLLSAACAHDRAVAEPPVVTRAQRKAAPPPRPNQAGESAYAQKFGLTKMDLVNQAMGLRFRVRGSLLPDGSYAVMDPREICDRLTEAHPQVQRTPKTFSCVTYRLNDTTVTISAGGENTDHLRVNAAGMNNLSSFLLTAQLLADELERASGGRIVVTGVESTVMNHVIVLGLVGDGERSGLCIERLIDTEHDELSSYEPGTFSGANFVMSAVRATPPPGVVVKGGAQSSRFLKCEKQIAFDSNKLSFLGVKNLGQYMAKLPARLALMRSCAKPAMSHDAKHRQRQRVEAHEAWLSQKRRRRAEEEGEEEERGRPAKRVCIA